MKVKHYELVSESSPTRGVLNTEYKAFVVLEMGHGKLLAGFPCILKDSLQFFIDF